MRQLFGIILCIWLSACSLAPKETTIVIYSTNDMHAQIDKTFCLAPQTLLVSHFAGEPEPATLRNPNTYKNKASQHHCQLYPALPLGLEPRTL